jgi:hypothetical protein
MALSKTINTPHGITVTDAYHRVEGLELLSKSQARFQLRAYANTTKAAIDDKAYVMAYDLGGDNPIRQAYLHLKTLPEFADAVDC